MRCQGCGRPAAVGAVQCAACGDALQLPVRVVEMPSLPTEWHGSPPVLSPVRHSALAPRNVAAERGPSIQRPVAVIRTRPAPAYPVQGRVILVEGPLVEPMGFDWTLLLCQILWLGLLLVIPFLLLHALMSLILIAPGILLILVIAWFLGLLSPRHLLQAVSLIFRMGQWGRTGGDTVPVRYLRVRDPDTDQEAVVRLVGHLSAANVLVDDLVGFRGRRRRGLLYATSGRNLRTGSRIRVRSTRSQFLLVVTVLVYAAVVLALVAIAHSPRIAGAI